MNISTLHMQDIFRLQYCYSGCKTCKTIHSVSLLHDFHALHFHKLHISELVTGRTYITLLILDADNGIKVTSISLIIVIVVYKRNTIELPDLTKYIHHTATLLQHLYFPDYLLVQLMFQEIFLLL